MRKNVYAVVLVLGVLIIAAFSNHVYGAPKSKAAVLTTMDVKEAYEVVGIVSYRTSATSFSTLITGIKKEAQSLNADAVVGLRCMYYGDFFYAYGTAVKFK